MTQGDAGDSMFFIIAGVIQLVEATNNTIIGTLGPGDYCGEMALLLEAPRTKTLRTDGMVFIANAGAAVPALCCAARCYFALPLPHFRRSLPTCPHLSATDPFWVARDPSGCFTAGAVLPSLLSLCKRFNCQEIESVSGTGRSSWQS